MYIHGDLYENPRKGETSKKVINKGFLRVMEGYEQSDKNTIRLPRQGIEHMFLPRLVGQNAANRGNRKKSYYGFTTTHQSNHNILYKININYSTYSVFEIEGNFW